MNFKRVPLSVSVERFRLAFPFGVSVWRLAFWLFEVCSGQPNGISCRDSLFSR
jgi:hypothetical protein